LLSFKYYHSTNHYFEQNGVKEGEIIIKDLNKALESQEWTEIDKDGVCQTKQQYLTQVEDNGIVKPNFYDLIK
jgi:hypothetical protein